MKQLNLLWDNPLRVDWMNFRHEEDYAGWLIIVKMYTNPELTEFPYEWTLKRGTGRTQVTIADPTSHRTIAVAISRAKEAIATYEDKHTV